MGFIGDERTSDRERVIAPVLAFFAAARSGGDPGEAFTQDATYVVASADSPITRSAIPWAGQIHVGQDGVRACLAQLGATIEILDTRIDHIMVEGRHVAAFGRLDARSRLTGTGAALDFALHAVVRKGKIASVFFYENTLAAVNAFRTAGSWEIATADRTVRIP